MPLVGCLMKVLIALVIPVHLLFSSMERRVIEHDVGIESLLLAHLRRERARRVDAARSTDAPARRARHELALRAATAPAPATERSWTPGIRSAVLRRVDAAPAVARKCASLGRRARRNGCAEDHRYADDPSGAEPQAHTTLHRTRVNHYLSAPNRNDRKLINPMIALSVQSSLFARPRWRRGSCRLASRGTWPRRQPGRASFASWASPGTVATPQLRPGCRRTPRCS